VRFNDERGIDVGIMSKANFEIKSIRSNVDEEDAKGQVFDRSCPQYQVRTPTGAVGDVLLNHFKSQSGKGGGGEKRNRQATEVRKIVNGLVAKGEHVVVLGDLNEGPSGAGSQPETPV
jgi:endonuclease/exonuclease/phosphatase family metal-dependent hydrolase